MDAGGVSADNVWNICVNVPGPLVVGPEGWAAGGEVGNKGSVSARDVAGVTALNICVKLPGSAVGLGASGGALSGLISGLFSVCKSCVNSPGFCAAGCWKGAGVAAGGDGGLLRLTRVKTLVRSAGALGEATGAAAAGAGSLPCTGVAGFSAENIWVNSPGSDEAGLPAIAGDCGSGIGVNGVLSAGASDDRSKLFSRSSSGGAAGFAEPTVPNMPVALDPSVDPEGFVSSNKGFDESITCAP